MQELTGKQAQVLAYIQQRLQRTGRVPSYRDIAAQLGVTVRTVPVSPLPPNVIDLDAIRDKRSRKRNTHHETVREACLKSIRQDPEVRAFLDRKPVRPA